MRKDREYAGIWRAGSSRLIPVQPLDQIDESAFLLFQMLFDGS